MNLTARPWPRLRDAAIVGLLAVLTVATYLPVLSYGFVDWDDPMYVTDNPAVQNGLTWENVGYALTTFDTGNWAPLTWLSLMLDATLFGIRPAGFHATNIAWHAANVCLVYVVLRRLTGVVGGSLAVAAFFAVHPLHVESVAWVSERKDVLSTFWLLITVLAYAGYARQPTRWRMFGIGAAMTLGLLAKPMLVTLPVLLLVLDVWPLRRLAGNTPADGSPTAPKRTWLELVVEKRSLFVLVVLSALVTIAAQQSLSLYAGVRGLPMSLRIGNAVQSYGWYLMKTVWPTGLCVFYPHPLASLSWGNVAAWACVLVAITGWAWLGRREQPYRLAGWLWFLIALLPVIGLLQVGGQAYADRYSYVPHIGLFVVIVWEARHWWTRLSGLWSPRSVIAWPVGLTACLVAACAWAAREQMATWRDSDTLWARALELDPEHPMAHLQIAQRDLAAGELDAAEDHFRRVLFRQPTNYNAVVGLARVHEQRGDGNRAAGHYAWALRLNPRDQFAAYRFATLRPGEQPTVTVPQPAAKPEARSRFRAGLIRYDAGRPQAALECYLDAVRIDPNFADAHTNAGLVLQELGRRSAARPHLEAAVRLVPDNPVFHFHLALLLEELGDFESARRHYEAVQRLSPSDPEPAFRMERWTRR